jgi:hypothetical protein
MNIETDKDSDGTKQNEQSSRTLPSEMMLRSVNDPCLAVEEI